MSAASTLTNRHLRARAPLLSVATRHESSMLPCTGHTVNACGGEILCFGGLCESPPAGSALQLRPKTAPARKMTQSLATGGARASAALHAYSYSEDMWHPLAPENGTLPPARSGHAAAALSETSLIVFGGTDQQHKKLSDVWQLDRMKNETRTMATLELVMDAWTPARAEQEMRAAEAIGSGGEVPSVRKDVLRLENVVLKLGAALGGLPPECFVVNGGEEETGTPGGLTVRVGVRPLVGVGLAAVGADGERLPEAVISAAEAKLSKVCPMPASDEEGRKGEPEGIKKGGKGKEAAGEDEAAARAAAARATIQQSLVGYPLLSWR